MVADAARIGTVHEGSVASGYTPDALGYLYQLGFRRLLRETHIQHQRVGRLGQGGHDGHS